MAEQDSKKSKKNEEGVNTAYIVSDRGKPMLGLLGLGYEGDKLEITGTLMGAWPTKFYMDPENVAKAVQIVLSSPALIGYIMKLPALLAEVAAKAAKE